MWALERRNRSGSTNGARPCKRHRPCHVWIVTDSLAEGATERAFKSVQMYSDIPRMSIEIRFSQTVPLVPVPVNVNRIFAVFFPCLHQ